MVCKEKKMLAWGKKGKWHCRQQQWRRRRRQQHSMSTIICAFYVYLHILID